MKAREGAMNVSNVNTFQGFKVRLEIKLWISANIYSFENFMGLLTYERVGRMKYQIYIFKGLISKRAT